MIFFLRTNDKEHLRPSEAVDGMRASLVRWIRARRDCAYLHRRNVGEPAAIAKAMKGRAPEGLSKESVINPASSLRISDMRRMIISDPTTC